IAFALESFAEAANAGVAPIVTVRVLGDTITAATSCFTVRLAVPDTVPVVAVIVTVPPPSARTRPRVLVLAMSESEEVQVKVSPATTLPAPSLAVAVKGWERPSATSVDVVGETLTATVDPASTLICGSVVVTGVPFTVAPMVVAVPASAAVNVAEYV